MATLTVELPLSEADRAVLEDALAFGARQVGEPAVATAVKSGKVVLPDGETVEPSDESAPESDEDKERFKELAEAAYDKAKSLLADKENKPANAARIQAILEEIGVEKVSAITTLEQAEQFLAALDS